MKYQYDKKILAINHYINAKQNELVFIEQHNSIFLYYVNDEAIIVLLNSKYNYKTIYYLDRFIILLPLEYGLQNQFWISFYECIGNDYELLIDKKANISCINTMIAYIQDRISISDNGTILDFGCGTGISNTVSHKGRLVGYEPIKEMRKQAEDRGMIVYNTIDMIIDSSIDAVFSSFVLHMGILETDIHKIITKMKEHAIWVANYYNGINEDIVNSFMLNSGLSITQISSLNRIGHLYEYRK